MNIKTKKIGTVTSHFLDSGAFTQWTECLRYQKKNNCGRWDYYETDDFWNYINAYIKFIKKHKVAIDLYANLDVIGNPELSLRNQKYMEKKGLSPVPVVHYGSDLKWINYYIDNKYEMIGLGGLVGNSNKKDCRHWIDKCFDIICNTKDRIPKIKTHGFGVTSFKILLRYPWYSVDSAAWDKIALFGGICVPHERKNKFVFNIPPYVLKVSMESPERKKRNHFFSLKKQEQMIIKKWLAYINIPLGSLDEKGEIREKGVITYHVYRRIANIFFYNKMINTMPSYPQPFYLKRRPLL